MLEETQLAKYKKFNKGFYSIDVYIKRPVKTGAATLVNTARIYLA